MSDPCAVSLVDDQLYITLVSDCLYIDVVLNDCDPAPVPSVPYKMYTVGETIAATDFAVNIYDDSGTLKVRPADATNGRPANGIVLGAGAVDASIAVYFSGIVTLSGMTAGNQWLQGGKGIGTTPPDFTTSGNIIQSLGCAHSATEFNIEIEKDYMTVP